MNGRPVAFDRVDSVEPISRRPALVEGRRAARFPARGGAGAEGRARVREGAPRIDAVQLALFHLLEMGKDLPVAEGHRGNPVHRPDPDDLVDGVPARPIGDGLQHIRPTAIDQDLQRLIVCQVGSFDHFEERRPLRHGDRGHPDVAVAAGLDAGGHRVGRAPALAARHARRYGRIADEGHREGFEGGDVDEVAEARSTTRRAAR